MPEPTRVVLLLRPVSGGKRAIAMLDPATGRESNTGLVAGPDQQQIDDQIRSLKQTFERSGSTVDVKYL